MIANTLIPDLTGEEFTRLALALIGVIGTIITVGGGIILQVILSRQKANTAISKAVESKVDAMTQNLSMERKVESVHAEVKKAGETTTSVVIIPPLTKEGGADSAKL